MESYGVTGFSHEQEDEIQRAALAKIPNSHRDYLRALLLYWDTPTTFFSHAGINPNVPLSAQSEDDLIWIRAPFHDVTTPHPKLIIHGHTPVDEVTHYGNRINIDTGAAYGRKLSAIVLDGLNVQELTGEGRAEILRSI